MYEHVDPKKRKPDGTQYKGIKFKARVFVYSATSRNLKAKCPKCGHGLIWKFIKNPKVSKRVKTA